MIDRFSRDVEMNGKRISQNLKIGRLCKALEEGETLMFVNKCKNLL